METKITAQSNTLCFPPFRLRAIVGRQTCLQHRPSQPHMQKSAQIQVIKFLLAAGGSPWRLTEENCSYGLDSNTFALRLAPCIT